MHFVDLVIFVQQMHDLVIFVQQMHSVHLLDKYNKKKLSLDIISVSHFY